MNAFPASATALRRSSITRWRVRNSVAVVGHERGDGVQHVFGARLLRDAVPAEARCGRAHRLESRAGRITPPDIYPHRDGDAVDIDVHVPDRA